MKNLLTYINPHKCFNNEHKMAVKIQIDNSLRLGWKREDIMLVTNFDYEYNGVKSIVIEDENYCEHFFPSTKIYVIAALFHKGLIDDDLYWYHDFDCFQLNPMMLPSLGEADLGLTNYGKMPRLCSASMFFTKNAGDLFYRMHKEIKRHKTGEERSIMEMNNFYEYGHRVRVINLTYALHKFNLWHCYNRAAGPIQAVHFHLTPDKYDFWVKGNNPVNLRLIPDELISIFNKHGFTG